MKRKMQTATEAQEAVFARYRQMDNETLMADAEANATGQRLFANSCAMCHGSDARGAKGFPNLADNDWLYGDSFDTVMHSYRQRPCRCHAGDGGGLDDKAIGDLVVYVQSMSGQKADPEMAANGKKNYDMLCVACHRPTVAETRHWVLRVLTMISGCTAVTLQPSGKHSPKVEMAICRR